MSLAVGVTGGIGSGKSTVCRLFAELGVPVIDADAIARGLVAPGSPALTEILRAFGGSVLAADGNLQRERLRQTVFADPARKRELEAILHPRIKAEMRRQWQRSNAPYSILCIPLLVEAHWGDLVQRVLVVDTPESVQISRTVKRDGLTEAAVEAIMRAQAPRAMRLARADDVILNDRDPEYLRHQVRDLHNVYLAIAKRGEPAAER